jgi:predicted tellurium resistance membrane protein TerC
MIETSDLIFALDSLSANFSITRDSFLMFTSNIMAVRGLRSLYFALAGAVDRFRHLRNSLGLLLVLIGIKFLLKDVLAEGPITVFLALGAVAIIFKRDHRIVALWEACAQLLLEISSVQRWVSRFSGLRAHANPDGVRLEPL